MGIKIKIIMLLTAALWHIMSAAQEPVRPVASAWMAEVGGSEIADTYLSPLKYKGMHYSLTYSRLQAMKRPMLVQGWDVSVAFDDTSIMGLTIDGSWRIMRRWYLKEGFQLGVGGNAGLQAGALYKNGNSNNPVQAIASITAGVEGYAQWSGKLKKLPLAVRWQVSTPLLGTFFCPDYGELYYEIALGNHSGLAHFAWPGSYRRVRSLLSVDMNFGNHTLRLGYRFDALSSRANNITSRRISHAAVIGVVCDFVNVNPRKNDAKVITAYY